MESTKNKRLEELLALWDGNHPRASADRILRLNPHVTICHNNEIGKKWLWSVVLTGTDLWLFSKNSLKGAEDRVKKYKVKYDIVDLKKS